MPPKRAAAKKAAALNAQAIQATQPVKPPSTAAKTSKKGKKRAASVDPQDAQDTQDAKDKSEGEDDQPPKKKAKVDDDVEDKPAKMVTVVQRGNAIPVDAMSGMSSSHEVYVVGEETYSAMLNQTQIQKNANKFYSMQLLAPRGTSDNIYMFNRWGRVGENGQTQKKGPWSAGQAIREFLKQYKSKSGSDWAVRRTAPPKPGKYAWIELDFGDDEEEKPAEGSGNNDEGDAEKVPIPEVVAKPPVQDLIRLIFNTELMDAHLKELNYDANKLPLGKMSKTHILQGFEALKKLGDVINDPNGAVATEMGGFQQACDALTGVYYSIIPHLFNRNTRPTTINTDGLLKREVDLVAALGDMSIATKLLQSANEGKSSLHPIDARLKGLNLDSIDALEHGSKEFTALETYLHDTHGGTHRHFQPKVQEIFKVTRIGEGDRFEKDNYHQLDDGQRKLLWHGSRTSNFGGILSQGLRIAPPEAPVSGYMFGKGVYFADSSSKSLGYTYHHLSDNTGLLLLCEVAVDPAVELCDAAYDAADICKKAKTLATKGIGLNQPTDWQDAAEATGNEEMKGIWMPKGNLSNVSPPGAWLQYNEYIVYDTSQVRLRYLLRVGL